MNGPGSIAAWLVGRRQARDRADAAAAEPEAGESEDGDRPGEDDAAG
jgi:hypothetical protein